MCKCYSLVLCELQANLLPVAQYKEGGEVSFQLLTVVHTYLWSKYFESAHQGGRKYWLWISLLPKVFKVSFSLVGSKTLDTNIEFMNLSALPTDRSLLVLLRV